MHVKYFGFYATLVGSLIMIFLTKIYLVSRINTDRLSTFFHVINLEEMPKVARVLELDVKKLDNNAAKNIFYHTLSFPIQGVCKVLKRVGGNWVAGPQHQVDGDKFVCLDNIIKKDSCIVYSFGISNDWTFEDVMDKIGCQIFAYDHTINADPRRGNNINFFKTGLGIGENLKTLQQLMFDNNQSKSTIDYLKIDIEGAEFNEGGFRDWIQSGVLNYVDQIALELHMTQNNDREYIEAMEILQDLYNLGFRVISHEVNMVAGPSKDDLHYHYFEVVFMKVNN